jgi:predicted phage-related endonuclease
MQLAEPILVATIIDNLEPEIQDENQDEQEPAKTFDEEVAIERKKMIKLHTSSLALNELHVIKEIITRLEKDIKNIKSRLKMLI